MALGDNRKILVGAATLYVGPSGTDAPAAVAGTSFRTTMDSETDWRNVGYTQDGLEVATDPSFADVEVDQLLDAAVIFKDGMGLSVSTTLAEATLENLLIAWGQAEETLSDTGTGDLTVSELSITGGELGDAPLERGLIAVGNAPKTATTGNKYNERTYHLYRVLSVEGSSHTMARADATVLPVTFRALPADDGEYGVIRDRNPSATA